MATATPRPNTDMKNEKKAVQDISGEISYFANKAGNEVRHYLDAANEQIATVTDTLTDEVRTNPLRTLLTAAGIGFVLGALFRR